MIFSKKDLDPHSRRLLAAAGPRFRAEIRTLGPTNVGEAKMAAAYCLSNVQGNYQYPAFLRQIF